MDEGDASTGSDLAAEAAAAAAIKARSGGRRRSCNRCSAKKERCDGQEPCHRCLRSGLECLYATCRTLGRPRNAGAPGKRRLSATTAAAAAAPATGGTEGADSAEGAGVVRSAAGSSTAPRNKSGGRVAEAAAAAAGTAVAGAAAARAISVGAATAVTGVTPTTNTNRARAPARPRARAGAGGGAGGKGAGSAKGAKAAPARANLKRPSLSPSPATGLTGLVQGRYLTCFMDDFACYFQVLDDSVLRLGLINLMTGKIDPALLGSDSGSGWSPLPPPAKRSVGAGGGRGSGRGYGSGGSIVGVNSGSAGRGGGTRALSSVSPRHGKRGPSAAVLNPDVYAVNSAMFSAMALGALLLGQPPDHVHLYVAVAEASLRPCSAEMAVTPNERVAAAHLLLAFAANVSGMPDYGRYIRLTRQCYYARVRRGLPTPTPIRDILGYREIIDALGKPIGTGGCRVPAPQQAGPDGGGAVAAGPSPAPVASGSTDSTASNSDGTATAAATTTATTTPAPAAAAADGMPTGGAPDARGSGSSGGGGGGGAIPPTVRESLPKNGQGEGVAAGTTASAAGGGVGVGAEALPAEGRARPAAVERARRKDRNGFPHGLEAARERARLRQAEPMLMVGDIMTMLSRVPWSMKGGEEARRTRQELTELKSLLAAEKALAEERRFVSAKKTSRTDRMSVFALATALIGLNSALDQFAELLSLAREVSVCVCACPGLARYQPHSYHAALAILRAFEKQKEFNALLAAAPGELRRSTTTGKTISYETREDMCSWQVCLKHAKAIGEMGRRAWERERARTHGRAPVEVAADEDVSVVAVTVKGEPVSTPAGGREGNPPPVVVSRVVALDPNSLEERCQLPGETASPAGSVPMVSPSLRPEKTPGRVSAADAASASSEMALPAAAANLPEDDSPDLVGQWTPEFPASLGASPTVSNRPSPSRSVAGGAVATFDCAPRGGEGALMGGPDGDNSLLLLQPPLALRSSSAPGQGVDVSAFASATTSAVAVGTPASSAAGRGAQLAAPRARPLWSQGADWNAALAGETYRGVGGGASGVGSDVAGAAAGYSIAGDVDGTTRRVAGGGGGGGGSGSGGGADDALANPLLSSLRIKQARSVGLYGVNATGKGPVLDSACPLASGQRVTGAGGAAGAASATSAGGSSADEGAGVSPGLSDPHRDWRGSGATSAPGSHLAPLHQPADVGAAGLGARLPSSGGGALTRRLWDSRLAPRDPGGGVEFVSPHGGGAANLPPWRWESSLGQHPPLLPGPVARRVAQPAFPPGSMSVADSPMFAVSGGPAASALAVAATAAAAAAATAAAARATSTSTAMAPAVLAPSSSSYLLAPSTSMSAGTASAAAISSAAARAPTANPSMRGCGDAGGGGAPHREDADETSLDTSGIEREEDDDATRDLWEIIGAADGSE